MFGSIRHEPQDEVEVAEIIRRAADRFSPLRIEGGGTKSSAGRPIRADTVLSSANLRGITMHEPSELIIQARSGTPVDVVQALLREKGQDLPFEPPSLSSLYGARGRPTIGALAAMNLSGPRRISVGAARDCLLGVRFVNGRGEIVKSGGRVMKNVTGLDLVKLVAGSWGTLGFITEVTFKVLPSARASGTLCIEGLSDADAIEILTRAMGSSYDVSGAAHIPEQDMDVPAQTLVRIEGSSASVEVRANRLRALLGEGRTVLSFDEERSAAIWSGIRELTPLRVRSDEVVWRLSVPPDCAAEVTAFVGSKLEGARWYFDWSGGLIWLALPSRTETEYNSVRMVIQKVGGHATLVRASEDVRRSVPVFQELPPALMAITAQLKHAFDPAGILNPSLMYERI
ncbi:MAG: glycolate oxidase subunit GlcE [Pseudonocardiaceae bacterium]|nr:MAG: glycolate oxidase subunit GlcE [Pseudonocardiaceae bacterium]